MRQGTGARPACLVQPDQLQAWRCLGREAVELEGEIHGLWPRRSLAVLGRSESNKSPQLIRHPRQRTWAFKSPAPQARRCLVHPCEQVWRDQGSPLEPQLESAALRATRRWRTSQYSTGHVQLQKVGQGRFDSI